MEDRQRVYIKGNLERGAEVIKTLTDLGGRNIYCYAGDSYDSYYFINPDGIISNASPFAVDGAFTFVKEFYKEIKLPERKRTDGDLLVQSDGGKKEYVVYSNNEIDDIEFKNAIKAYICVSEEGYSTYVTCDTSNAKIATKDDIGCFQKLLHRYEKEWDFKNKKLIYWKWKPEYNNYYYYIGIRGEIKQDIWKNTAYENSCYKFGNCFRNYSKAKAARDKIEEILKNNN